MNFTLNKEDIFCCRVLSPVYDNLGGDLDKLNNYITTLNNATNSNIPLLNNNNKEEFIKTICGNVKFNSNSELYNQEAPALPP